MFSPEKIVHSFLENNEKESLVNLSWKNLFKEFFCTLYFQNHLLKHFYQPYPIIMCINENTDLKVLNLLNILTCKYSFFKLRQTESQNINIDLEQNYLLSLNDKISISDTCLLIGLNPRYEGYSLNLRLRSRFLKGNFKVIQIGSLINLTFSTINISSNTRILRSLVEGNNLFCQEFINSSNPILISNAEIFKRKDYFGLANMLNFLIKAIDLFSQSNTQSRLDILHPSLNGVGFANFNSLKVIKDKDLRSAPGIYFLHNSFATSNIKKLLNLKLLKIFRKKSFFSSTFKYSTFTKNKSILITQSSNFDTKLVTQLKKGFNFSNHLHLPNTVFFETSGNYMNTEGNVNKTIKIIKPLGQTKDD
jgi:NADH dehydrogenase/NADH:ubiquinone oxidoreductase subunit G